MLDIKFILKNVEAVKENCRIRHCSVDINRMLALEEERRKFIQEIETTRAHLNKISRSLRGTPLTEEQRDEIRDLKERAAELSKRFDQILQERKETICL
jgi:seryl-tRNA synthetase